MRSEIITEEFARVKVTSLLNKIEKNTWYTSMGVILLSFYMYMITKELRRINGDA